MTPDAVIYRYLQIVAPVACDREKLCLLLSADADLLTRWLKLLGVPADFDLLQARIERLDAQEFTGIAQAQAWSVLPLVGSARLSLDQWLAVLRAAYLAEILANYLHDKSDLATSKNLKNVRLRALLAISGVQLTQDPELSQLIAFRGTNPDLLEDAGVELRIFAVIDAIEVGGEVALAEQLLDIPADSFATLVQQAEQSSAEFISELQIDTHSDVDWTRKIWLRQQVGMVGASFTGSSNWQGFLTVHNLVSRCLFVKPPLLLVQTEAGAPLKQLGSSDVAINLNSRTSLIAAAARDAVVTGIRDSNEIAVVDRQMLRALGVEDALAVPIVELGEAALLLVATDDDINVELAAELYAEEVAQHAKRFKSQDFDKATENDVLVEQFRASEYERLREIVHEANNPLSIVHNYLHILELRLKDDSEAVAQLELIGGELRRAGDVFTRARDIPNQIQVEVNTPGELTEIDLNIWLSRLAELHSGLAAENGVLLNTNLPAQTQPSTQSPRQSMMLVTEQDKLAQVITNLLKNAIEACAPGDEVQLGARGNVYRGGRMGVELFVEDTGPGLTDEILQNLAGAKISGKGGEHQGLGLHVAFRLATEMDGALDVRTDAVEGTTFSLFLPHAVAVSDS